MKPKDLKPAFNWEDRRPLLIDRVFHVPQYYFLHHEFSFPKWEDSLVFGNQNPVCIEYCAGNGAWIVQQAKKFPYFNWIAVEKRFDRVRQIWSKTKNENLSNVFIVHSEALVFTRHHLPDDSSEEIFINFPDPWPKSKHAKNRLMTPLFLDELARILKEGRKVTFVSDDFNYLTETINLFKTHPSFKAAYPSPHFTTQEENYGNSWFEELWRKKGRTIRDTQWTMMH
ncbi:MAG: tRNA (guanine(46)-N(7))-methyltransferase TrmB [Chlamydiales bacterium]